MSLHKARDLGLGSSCDFKHSDVLEALQSIASESVQLVISSPPYNIRKKYERDGKRSLDQYVAWQTEVARLAIKCLRVNGSLCWQTGNYVNEGEIIPLDSFFISIFRKMGLKLRNRIIWRFNFGLNADRRFSGRYETLLWFTKSDDYVFNLDPVRIPQIYPGKRHAASKGPSRAGLPSGNPLGKNPSDFWEFLPSAVFWSDPVWEIPNVKANHPEKSDHPCQFPMELVERCVLALTNPNDLVLDPFVGTGASCLAAVKHARSCIGIDKEAEFIAIAQARLELLRKGALPMRKFGQAITRKGPADKVSKIPEQWLAAEEYTDGQGVKR